jgi:hypothetical protein
VVAHELRELLSGLQDASPRAALAEGG